MAETKESVKNEVFTISIPHNVPEPMRWSAESIGIDVYSAEAVSIPPHTTVMVKLNAKIMEAALVFGRSSLWKMGVMLANGVGVIDGDYRGQISAPLMNFTDDTVNIEEGIRIAQIIPMRQFRENSVVDFNVLADNNTFENFDTLYPTDRGAGGFGSTWK